MKNEKNERNEIIGAIGDSSNLIVVRVVDPADEPFTLTVTIAAKGTDLDL